MTEANSPRESHANDDYGRENTTKPTRIKAIVVMLFLECPNRV